MSSGYLQHTIILITADILSYCFFLVKKKRSQTFSGSRHRKKEDLFASVLVFVSVYVCASRVFVIIEATEKKKKVFSDVKWFFRQQLLSYSSVQAPFFKCPFVFNFIDSICSVKESFLFFTFNLLCFFFDFFYSYFCWVSLFFSWLLFVPKNLLVFF